MPVKWNPSQDELRRMLRDSGLLPPRPNLRIVGHGLMPPDRRVYLRPPTRVDRVRIFIAQVFEMLAGMVRPPVRT